MKPEPVPPRPSPDKAKPPQPDSSPKKPGDPPGKGPPAFGQSVEQGGVD